MKFFPKILALLAGCLMAASGIFGQTTPITTTIIPFSSTDIVRPHASAEDWNHQNVVSYPSTTVQIPRTDLYYRFRLTDICPYNSPIGTYDWTKFDQQFKLAIDANQLIGIDVMNLCATCSEGGTVNNAHLAYPLAWHNQMQAESSKDFIINGQWIPNYNSAAGYLNPWKNMWIAINNHVDTSTYVQAGTGKLVRFKDMLSYVDVTGMGDYGEWSNNPWNSSGNGVWLGPAGTQPTIPTYDSIASYVIHAMNNYWCVAQIAMFDCKTLPGNTNNPVELAWYVLSTSNAKGKVGWRRESWGWTDWWNVAWTTGNTHSFNGMNFDTAISNRYKYAPVNGEPADLGLAGTGTSAFAALPQQMLDFNVNRLGNGNLDQNLGNASAYANFRAAFKNAGYRYQITGGSMPTTLSSGGSFPLTLNWQNVGNSPTYDDWTVTVELRSGATVVKSYTSTKVLKLSIPGSPVATTDNFSLSGVNVGTYGLYVTIKPTNGYGPNMPLAITGQNADGSYLLRGGINVTAGSGPVANAGPDQTISLPTSSVTLNGSGSTGTTAGTANLVVIFGESNGAGEAPNAPLTPTQLGIRPQVQILNNSTFLWESLHIGFNNQINLGNPTNVHSFENGLADTVVSGALTNPTYLVKIGVPGTRIGQWLSDSASATPNVLGWTAAVVPRMDTAIKLLQGAGLSYKITVWWTIGINDYNAYGYPNAAYVTRMLKFMNDFRARYGANIQFIQPLFVTGYPYDYPYNTYVTSIAAADPLGINTTVSSVGTQYTDSSYIHWNYQGMKLLADRMAAVMVSGSTITTYLWTQVSGPNTANIAVPTAVTTTVSGLVQGVYVFRLTLNGGVSFDDVQITVNQSVGSGTTIFTTQVPASVTDNDHQPTVGMEVGTRFRSTEAGTITGVRFYKTAGNTGTHIGELYSNTGTRLAQVTFVGETATGWQIAKFSNPVQLQANTNYVVAVFSSLGNYVEDNQFFFNTAVNNPPLTAIVDGSPSGNNGQQVITDANGVGNGVFIYTATPAFPNKLYRSANYYVDVIYSPPVISFNVYTTQTPNVTVQNDGQALEVGMKFRTSVNGYVIGARFYKLLGDTGTHIAEVYSLGGLRLAQATFTNETASGWQNVIFAAPVFVTAGTTYMVSYFSSLGYYGGQVDGFDTDIINGPVTGLADGVDGHNGLYKYTNVPAIPDTYSTCACAPTYWVDLFFTVTPPVTPPGKCDLPCKINGLKKGLPKQLIPVN